MHLSWLRRKLGETAAHPAYLHSVRGVGVRLAAPRTPRPPPTARADGPPHRVARGRDDVGRRRGLHRAAVLPRREPRRGPRHHPCPGAGAERGHPGRHPRRHARPSRAPSPTSARAGPRWSSSSRTGQVLGARTRSAPTRPRRSSAPAPSRRPSPSARTTAWMPWCRSRRPRPRGRGRDRADVRAARRRVGPWATIVVLGAGAGGRLGRRGLCGSAGAPACPSPMSPRSRTGCARVTPRPGRCPVGPPRRPSWAARSTPSPTASTSWSPPSVSTPPTSATACAPR